MRYHTSMEPKKTHDDSAMEDDSPAGTPVGDDSQMGDDTQAELQRYKDLAARAQADLQNAKERLRREGEEMRAYAVESFVRGLLTTMDNFERAFKHLPEELKDNEWVKGMRAVEQDFIRKVQEAGVSKIDSLGGTVDPDRHEVLQAGPGEEGVITEVFEDGYELRGRVLRPAKVKVGDGSEAA